MSPAPEFRTRPFQYDMDDLQALARQVRGTFYRRVRLAGFVVIGMLALTVAIDMSIAPTDLDWAAIACGVIASILLFLFSNLRFRSWVWLKLMKQSAFDSPNSFGLLPRGLFLESVKVRSEIAWEAIREVKRDDSHVFFFMSKLLAYIVPQRAFDDPQEFEAFAEAAGQHWRRKHSL